MLGGKLAALCLLETLFKGLYFLKGGPPCNTGDYKAALQVYSGPLILLLYHSP